jgi:hypothetical protein
MSQEEYQARLTNIAHSTISYLARQGHLSEKEMQELLETVVVVPVANNTLFGRLRDYLFGKDTKEDKTYSQYIVTQIL